MGWYTSYRAATSGSKADSVTTVLSRRCSSAPSLAGAYCGSRRNCTTASCVRGCRAWSSATRCAWTASRRRLGATASPPSPGEFPPMSCRRPSSAATYGSSRSCSALSPSRRTCCTSAMSPSRPSVASRCDPLSRPRCTERLACCVRRSSRSASQVRNSRRVSTRSARTLCTVRTAATTASGLVGEVSSIVQKNTWWCV